MRRFFGSLLIAMIMGLLFMFVVLSLEWLGQNWSWISGFVNQFPRDSRLLAESGLILSGLAALFMILDDIRG